MNAIQSFYREFIYNVVKLSSNGFDESIVFTLENLEAMSFEVKDYNSDTNENILSDSQIAEDNNPIYANNVGLVLVHPFISTLFKNLELVQNHEFVNKKAREKAVYLLYYAVSGLQNPKEYELVVPKILCGFPIHSVISNQVFLSPNELSEIDDMLKGMIANWEILNNTSIEGLRDGFLKRKGKINIHADKIKILVEKGSIDMLLDYLPWNLSHIKLPWLKHIIQVEWR
ncbi:contractile injection system tape measure protein [Sphingobacterium daejeonense]|uniref:contractile injection system tape measure protein n=1 Tax=Sphingobacterium daejeonense TaxID=371142 RepID=UPI0010FE7ECF|nr:contractile injection system tape measure protein [Sphingobacterium daejeonense]